MVAPVYISQVSATPSLTTPPKVEAPDATIISEALAGTGEALSEIGQLIRRGAEETRAAQATTDYLTRLDELETRYRDDPDFQNAPMRFKADRMALEGELLGRQFTAETRAKLQQRFRERGISSQGKIDTVALVKNSQQAEANLDQQEGLWFRHYEDAATDVAQGAVLGQWERTIDDQVTAGTVSIASAEQRKLRFRETVAEARAYELMRTQPREAAALIAELDLPPVKRQRLLAAAEVQGDEIGTLELADKATADPPIASLAVGRTLAPSHLEAIFDRAVIPQESGGRADAVSPKGAIGVAQLMPATARETAKELSEVAFDHGKRTAFAEIAGLDDSALENRLKLDDVANREIGLAYLGKMNNRYGGSLPLALAGYNAGPANADRWKKEAEKLYGPRPTPAQILSVIDFKETRDYVAAIYGRMGAPLDTGLSPAAWLKAANRVGEIVAAETRREEQMASDLASATRATGNEIIDAMKAGLSPAPDELAEVVLTNKQAAARGDRTAAAWLRSHEEAADIYHVVRQAQRMPPEQLSATLSGMRRQAANTYVTTRDLRLLNSLEAVAVARKKSASDNPIGLGDTEGLFQATTIGGDADFGSGAVREALAYRDIQAVAARDFYGGGLKPFRPEEAEAFKARLAEAGESDKLQVITALASTMRPAVYEAALDQIGANDGYFRAAGHVGRARPELARQILRGAELMNVEGVRKTVDETLRPALEETIAGDLYPPGSPAYNHAVNGAMAVYIARRGGKGELFSASDDGAFQEAIEEVAGDIVWRNGRKTTAPPNLSAGEFETLIDGLTDDDFPEGAIDGNDNPIPAAELARNAVLMPLEVGGTRYLVGLRSQSAEGNFAPVLTARLRPVVIDTDELLDRRAGQ